MIKANTNVIGLSPVFLASLGLMLSVTFYIADSNVPLGVAAGVPYVAVILMTLWMPGRRYVIFFAVLTSILVLLGLAVSPSGGIQWMVYTNRGLALFAIWACAFVIFMRYRTRLELKVEKRKLEDYLEITEAIIIVLDAHRKISQINKRGCDVLGYAENDLIGRDWLDFCICGGCENKRETTRDLFDSGLLPCVDDKVRHFEGQIQTDLVQTDLVQTNPIQTSLEGLRAARRDIRWNVVALKNDHGDIIGSLRAGIDITRHKQSESALIAAHNELENRVQERTRMLEREKERAELANRTKTEFLNYTSHELRTPLNAIIGFSEMMRDELFGPLNHDRYEDYIKDIHQSGTYLNDIISDILDVSKIEAGGVYLDESRINVERALYSCLKMNANKAIENGVNLTARIEDNLPCLEGDRRRFKQIIVNLVSNSIKFTPEKGNITLGAFLDQSGAIVVQVEDDGIGISESDQQTIFEPFARAESSHVREYDGLGLGLPIVKSLVELHDGTITLNSVLGKGTSFTIRFPPHRSVAADVSDREVSSDQLRVS